MDGTDIVWTFPWLLQPLIQPPVVRKSLKVAVGGRQITQCVAHRRGYRMHDHHGTIEMRVPFGAEGGRLKVRIHTHTLADVQYTKVFGYLLGLCVFRVVYLKAFTSGCMRWTWNC